MPCKNHFLPDLETDKPPVGPRKKNTYKVVSYYARIERAEGVVYAVNTGARYSRSNYCQC
jgi:hypothetical protein